MNPIQGGDPYLNQGMQQASGNIGVSDSFGGFGNEDNTAYAGGSNKWGDAFGDAMETAAKYAANYKAPKGPQVSSSGFSGGGGSFKPMEAPKADLSYLDPYTSPFTSGWKR